MAESSDFPTVMKTYLPYIRAVCATYPAHHRQDLVQEAQIGLYIAFRKFDTQKGSNFDAFAKRCIKNRVISAYRKFERSDRDQEFDEQADLIGDRFSRDSSNASETEDVGAFFVGLRKDLSKFELSVLDLFLEDIGYAEIAKRLGVSKKSVTDAMFRVRKKIIKKDPYGAKKDKDLKTE